MSVKQRLLNIILAHPKLVIFGIGLAITMAVGTVLGMAGIQQAHAFSGRGGF